MAYIVKDSNGNDITEEFRAKSYSGSSQYKAKLTINGDLVPNSQISKIVISSPIINKNDKVFTLGSFISQKITIKFRNLNNLNINSGVEVKLEIGQYIDSVQDYVYVPIGIYYIDEVGINYHQTCEITCLDKATFFKDAIDYSPCFVDGKATVDTILQYICTQCGVELGEYPTTDGDIETSMYDSSVSGKRWISYIAEIKGCNAKIDRDGKLVLKELKYKKQPDVTIDLLKCKSLVLSEPYLISKVTYFDAKRNFSAPSTETSTDYNTLIIRQDNPFVKDQTTIDNIYNVVKGFRVNSATIENYGDITLDCWDILNYVNSKELSRFTTLNNNTLTYEMTIMSKVETKIPTKQQQVTTNVKDDPISERRIVKTQVDLLEGTVETLTAKTSELDVTINQNKQDIIGMFENYAPASDVLVLEENVKTLQTDTYKKTEVNKILKGQFYDENGNKIVSEIVQTTSGTFDENGMLYEKTNAPTNTRINEIGVKVNNAANDTELLFAGYDEGTKQTVVRSDNMEVKHFFVLQGRSRLEDYSDGTGVYWVGD